MKDETLASSPFRASGPGVRPAQMRFGAGDLTDGGGPTRRARADDRGDGSKVPLHAVGDPRKTGDGGPTCLAKPRYRARHQDRPLRDRSGHPQAGAGDSDGRVLCPGARDLRLPLFPLLWPGSLGDGWKGDCNGLSRCL